MVLRPQFNMRMDERTARLMELLERKLNLGPANIMRLAIARLAQHEGIEEPPDTKS